MQTSSLVESDETLTAKDLNLPTLVPSIMQSRGTSLYPEGPKSDSEYEPVYPVSLPDGNTMEWCKQQKNRMDSDERQFIDDGVDWDGEGFTR